MKSETQIFVVHGALGSAEQMEPVAAALRELGEVTNVELPGHGATPLPADSQFNIQSFVEALRDAVQEQVTPHTGPHAITLPVVFGYSMGGYLALSLEVQYPGTFGAIVTLGTKFAWTPALALRELSRLDANIIQEKIPKFAGVLEQRHRAAGGWKLVLERTGALLVELGDKPLLVRETLASVRATVCIAVGELDDTVSRDEAAEYAGFIPAGSTHVIPNTPHPIERVTPADIVSLMRTVINTSG